LENFNFLRYNAFASYHIKNFDFYGEHVSMEKDNMNLGKLIFATVFNHNNFKGVFRASYRPWKENKYRFVLGGQAQVNKDLSVRAKVDSNTKVAVAAKYSVNKNVSLTAGVGGQINQPKSFTSGSFVPVPLGVQIDFAFN